MKSIRHVVMMAIVAMTFSVGTVVATSTPAHAAPTNCTAYVGTDGKGYARCLGGTGDYRVAIACKPFGLFGYYGYGFTESGNWARTGTITRSIAACPFGTRNWLPNSDGSYNAWIETR